MSDRFLHGFHETHRVVVFLNEVHGAVRERAHRGRDVAMPREKDDGKAAAALCELLMHFESRHAGHADVEHEAAWAVQVVFVEKRNSASPVLQFDPERSEKKGLACAVVVIVVHEPDERSVDGHEGFSLGMSLL